MNGMNTALMQSEIENARATAVNVSEDELTVELEDGRSISVPISFYPRLANGTPAERDHWELIGYGTGIHWEELDEDISIAGIILGRMSGESPKSFARWLEKRESVKDADLVAPQLQVRETRAEYATAEHVAPAKPRRLLGFSLTEYIDAALALAEYERDEDGKTVVAIVPGASGFFTQGDSFEEARENLRDAIEQVVITRLQLGWDLPEIPGVQVVESVLNASA